MLCNRTIRQKWMAEQQSGCYMPEMADDIGCRLGDAKSKLTLCVPNLRHGQSDIFFFAADSFNVTFGTFSGQGRQPLPALQHGASVAKWQR